MINRFVLKLVTLVLAATAVCAYVSPSHHRAWTTTTSRIPTTSSSSASTRLHVSIKEKSEEVTEKFGLEAGLISSLKQKDTDSAKSLLKKYGIAYLATSIPLALLSFAICYYLVDHGMDVGALLSKVGIDTSNDSKGVSETAGTFAIAYAAHKAASPIRFPPTVLLTPLVAKMIGKEPDEGVEET
jgi:hypothetical protein